MNTQKKEALAVYIADYVMEEQGRGNTIVDKWMILDAINAFEGGAYDIDVPAVEDGPVDWPSAEVIDKALASGFVGTEESEKFLQQLRTKHENL